MKVQDTLNNPSKLTGVQNVEERKAVESRGADFHAQLRRVETGNCEARIRELVEQIINQGEKLGKRTDIGELKVYKRLVSEFLRDTIANSHKFSRQNFLDRRGKHRVYAVVKNVNSELEALTQEVLNGEKDNIGILQRLDSIKGLILDIIM